MDPSKRNTKELNPRTTSSIFRVITFIYTLPLFKKCRKKNLDDNDIYEIPTWLASEKLGNQLEDAWLIQKKKKNEKASLIVALINCFGKRLICLGIIQLIVKTTLVFIQPKALSKVVAYFTPNQTKVTQHDLYLNASLIIALNIVSVIYNHNYQQFTSEVAIRIRTAVVALIYRKAVKLGPNAWNHVSAGKIVTLITKDVFAFDNALTFINDMWIGVIQTIIITGIIFARIEWSVFGGIGFYLLTVPIQIYVGKAVSARRVKSARKTDERLQLTKETIRNIKTIKMYTWENFFEQKINQFRKLELNHLSPVYYLKSIVVLIGSVATNISFFFMIMTYVWTGHFTNAETVYFIQSCYQSLKSYITVSIPMGIAQCSDLYASINRITSVLKLEELAQRNNSTTSPKILMKHVSVNIKGKNILQDISFLAEKGLNIITGNLGSGKSSIIKALLGEYPSSGNISVEGTISYASEEPWLFPSTIKQNIIFGEKYNEERYNEVLQVCALNLDLKKLEKGDQTVVGDGGVNFSKGQQARINLARAVYRNSDIYLLDDPLSGLDNRVNIYIFKKCIMEFLKDKIVVLVTNNINHIKLLNGHNTLYVENGRTLSIEKQKEALDKRITYYIDDIDMNNFNLDADITEEYGLDDDENTPLVKENKEYQDLYHENKKTGNVNIRTYFRYYKHAGGLIMFLTLVVLFVVTQIALSYSEKVVSYWVNIEPVLSELIRSNKTETTEYSKFINKRNYYLTLYYILIIVGFSLTITRLYMTIYFALRASLKLHNKMSRSVVNAFLSFFDKHLAGNIVNRFSKDLMTMDEVIPLTNYEIFRQTLAFLGILYLIISVNKIFILPSALLIIKLYFLQWFYLPTGRSTKRLDAATRSPMIGYLNSTLEGLPTVRAYDKQSLFISEFDIHQDHFTSASFMLMCSSRFFAFSLDMASTLFSSGVILKFVIFDKNAKAGDVGLAITQAMMLTGLLQWVIRQYTEMENNMTGVERILEYVDTPIENKTEGLTLDSWPSSGEIRYDNVSLTYSNTKNKVLKDISFIIKSKEKIGIVGRTGAGKSSIISTLFKLYNIEGKIFIDNVDTSTLSLKFLRSHMAIIPQDPILFSGSVRSNLDPEGSHTDEEIWTAMDKVNLKMLFENLDDEIVESGIHYSSGQRQLICLARALISKNKIIVMDEATSNMDAETCSTLQKIIRTNFSNCTVLTIAHRLNTVMDCDRIMVVDQGDIVEFDDPQVLRNKEDGFFYNMVKSGLE